jgi:hypothetical protein
MPLLINPLIRLLHLINPKNPLINHRPGILLLKLSLRSQDYALTEQTFHTLSSKPGVSFASLPRTPVAVTVPSMRTAFSDSESVDKPPTSTTLVSPTLLEVRDLAVVTQFGSVL